MAKTCSHIKFLMFVHLLTPLFQHLGESIPPFLSVKVDQDPNTVRPRGTRPRGTRTSLVHDFKKGSKIFEISDFGT